MKAILNVLCGLGLMASFVVAQDAVAGEGCVVHVNRTACKGKEEASYKKCKGKKECDKKERSAKTAEECKQKVLASECSNSRMDITHSKVVTAKFDGIDLEAPGMPDKSNKLNFCAPDQADFGKCDPAN